MPAEEESPVIVVGRIAKPHGIKGEVIVESQTEIPEQRFVAGATLFVGDPEAGPKPRRILAARPHQGRYIVSFSGVEDRNGAETLRGALLSIEADRALEAPPGRYYPHELVGFEVVDEAGTLLGKLTGVMENPANDLWVVETPTRPDVLVPAVKEFVRDVDRESRRIVIRPIPGLFDEE